MLKEISQLLVLQDRDRKIRALKQELKHAPLERRQLDEKLATTQTTLETLKQKAKVLEVERMKLEGEANSRREQIRKYETQKSATRKNEEFAALNTAIEHAEADIRKLEDKELEFMEAADQLKPQIAEAERTASATRESVARQIADLDAKVKALEAQIQEVQAERARSAEGLDEDLLDTYQRLFATKGEAVVPLEHEVCAGCHMKVTASTNARARGRRELVQCEQCGRILYFNEE
jgi:uncharacterized protein